MRKYIFKCLTLAVSLIINVNVCAAELPYSVSVDYANNRVKVTGTAPEESDYIIMQVLEKNKDFEDLEIAANPDILDMSVIMWSDQTTVSEDGEFTFDVGFTPELPAGNYNAYMVASGMGETRTEIILPLAGSEAYRVNIEKLNEYAEAGDMQNFSKIIIDSDGVSQLGFDLTLYNLVSASDKLDMYMEWVAENNLSSDASEYNKKMFNTFILMEALSQGDVVDNINSYIYDTIYPETEFITNYENFITSQAMQKHMTGKLSGKNYTSVDHFEEEMEAAIVLSTIRYADGYGDVKNVLSKYGDVVGISGKDSNTIYKKLSGNDYKDAEDLRDAYNAFKGSSNAGGSSFGGGGNSGVKDKDISMEGVFQQPEATENTQTKIDIPFIDIEDVEWASSAIVALADKGIIAGKGNGYFMPNDYITREEFVKILVNAMGYGEETYDYNVFSDVEDTDWFCSYVNIAYNKKLVNGIGNEMFGTGQLISRQDMVVMLYNALEMRDIKTEARETVFDDKNEIAGYALQAVNTLTTMGVVNGVSENEFDPLGNATRAQAAKVVYGILNYLQ